MTAILDGMPYPASLLARVVARCRAEQSVWPIRAALIKAILTRRSAAQEVTMNITADDPDLGARLGRLFAVLENIQRRAQPDLNVTIRDRFFGVAMTAPRSVFPQLMRLKNSHLKKLYRAQETRGLAIHFERQMDQILSALSEKLGLPASLSLEDQGRFILGYHHQRSTRGSGKAIDPSSDSADERSRTEITQ
jgi:CRISPR-associated protein Csd1